MINFKTIRESSDPLSPYRKGSNVKTLEFHLNNPKGLIRRASKINDNINRLPVGKRPGAPKVRVDPHLSLLHDLSFSDRISKSELTKVILPLAKAVEKAEEFHREAKSS